MTITEPLRLSQGPESSHQGYGCVMNIISWENGDSTITDQPACTDPMLARFMWQINDSYCEHTRTISIPGCDGQHECEVCDGDYYHDDGTKQYCGDEINLLCPECSVKMLKLGHRTVGTDVMLKQGKFAPENFEKLIDLYREMARWAIRDKADRTEDDQVRGWYVAMLEYRDDWRALEKLSKTIRCAGTQDVGCASSILDNWYCLLQETYDEDLDSLESHAQNLLTAAGQDLDQIYWGHRVMDHYLQVADLRPPRMSMKRVREAYQKMRSLVSA